MAFDCLTAFYGLGASQIIPHAGCYFCCFVAVQRGMWLFSVFDFCLFIYCNDVTIPHSNDELVWSRISLAVSFLLRKINK